MRLKFVDGSIRELPFNPELAARLIFRAQQRDNNVDYHVLLNPELSHSEKKRQTEQIQNYLDWYRMRKQCGKQI